MTSFAPQLRLYFLGPPEVYLGETLLAFPTRKTLALLIYLALEKGPQPREHLGALLWPESSTERCRASLRNTLNHLQTVLRCASGQAQASYLIITHNALALNPDADIYLDLGIVERAYNMARADRSSRTPPEGVANLQILQSAAACQRGDFLTGFSLGDAPGFDDWAALEREIWRRRLGLILDRLSEIQFASGEFAGATETASRWIALDKLNEAGYRRKMRAHFAAGERGQALDTYSECRVALAAELGLQPEPETEALALRIRTKYPFQPSMPRPHRPDTPIAFLENLFVGRSVEHQVLVDHYRRAAARQPQIVLLLGEVGIGKTRLAREFLSWADTQGAELLQGCAFESGSHLLFQPLIDALRIRLDCENSPKDLLDQVWFSPLSQLLPELCERYPELPPRRLETQIGQAQLSEPFVRVTLSLANQTPLVVFVDDLQWADSATLDLLLYAIRRWRERAARVLLLVSLRPEALHRRAQPSQKDVPIGRPMGLIDWSDHVAREIAPYTLELRQFGEHETAQMMLSILEPSCTGFVDWIYDETRGQPFYLMETLKDLLERGAIRPMKGLKGQWAFEVDSELDLDQAVRIPSTVQAVLRSRLNRLSPNAFSLLAAGAVLEHWITFERLCAIANVNEDLGLAALDELVSGRFLLEVGQPQTASLYTFTNDILREVVYTEAGDARRRLFHRRALNVLEASKESAAILAHHAQAAGLAAPALNYRLVAGQEALRLSAVSEAIVHFEYARWLVREASLPELLDETDLQALYVQLGQTYELAGQPDKASAVYTELEQVISDRGDTGSFAG